MATGFEELAQQAGILKDIISFFKVDRSEVHSNITDIAYEKLMETIKLLQKDKTFLENKKIEIDLSNMNIDRLSVQNDMSNIEKGVKINLKEKDDLDNQFEKFNEE